MTGPEILDIARDAIVVFLQVSMPVMVIGLVVGLVIALVQALTQIQEATLSFVPKAAGVGIALLLSGNWMLHEMTSYTQNLFEQIPTLLR